MTAIRLVGAVVVSLAKSQTACVNRATSELQIMRWTLNTAEAVEIPATKQIVRLPVHLWSILTGKSAVPNEASGPSPRRYRGSQS